jgi:hypothetical protein
MSRKIPVLTAILITIFLISSCSNKNILQSNKNEVNDKILHITDKTEYPVQIPVGAECTADLNKDGSNDSILYSVDTTKTTNHQSIISLKINNTEYEDKLFGELGFYMDNANIEWYYIVDIDKSDNFKEIAILDEGPSGDPETYFLRYDGQKLIYIGSVPDFPNTPNCKIMGNGTVAAGCGLKILQTWSAPMKWKLDENGCLKVVHEDMYYPYNYTAELVPELLKDFSVYIKPDLKADKISISAGSMVTFIATDNEHWVCLKTEDGKEGWFYMADYSNILINGKPVESTLIFKNLNFAG